MTTLDDLKAAIARVEEYRAMPLMDQLKCNVGFCAAERDGWRIGFDWLKDWNIRSGSPDADSNALLVEYNEAVGLIEKLR